MAKQIPQKEFARTLSGGITVTIVCSVTGTRFSGGSILFNGVPPRVEIKSDPILTYRHNNKFYTFANSTLVEVDEQIHAFLKEFAN